jgi:hypothetical protein
MKGARQLTWSRGMRRFFGLGLRLSDAAIAEEETRAVEDGFTLAEWDGEVWDGAAIADPWWVSRVASLETWELESLPAPFRVVRPEAFAPPD